MTGASSSSASSIRSSDASEYSTPWPAWITPPAATPDAPPRGPGRGHLDRPVRVDQGLGHLLAHDVGGDLDHGRARAPHAHQADGPAHDIRDLAAHGDGLDGLGDGR